MFHLYRKTIQSIITVTTLGLCLLVLSACTTSSNNTNQSSSTSPFNTQSSNNNNNNKIYHFKTINDQADPTFNQLLGINNNGTIAGYFGSGTVVNGTLHPNKGYTIPRPYAQGNFANENFPGSVQTQVTAINNANHSAGFWVDAAGNNFGFIKQHGKFTSYTDPNTGTSNGVQVNQLLGFNDNGIAVGFYTDSKGNDHGYALNVNNGKFSEVSMAKLSGVVSVMATGINNNNDIVGTFTDTKGATHGFLLKDKNVKVFDFTGAANVTSTTFLGINSHDQIVGTYTVGSGNAAQTHGFLLSNPLNNTYWQSIDDPNGVGTTTINGLNDNADLVGFYVDGKGNTDGMLATQS